MSPQDKNEQMKNGVVTFLDILGWKGVHYRKQNAIPKLKLLIEGLKNKQK